MSVLKSLSGKFLKLWFDLILKIVVIVLDKNIIKNNNNNNKISVKNTFYSSKLQIYHKLTSAVL